jgi:hypothetical protein
MTEPKEKKPYQERTVTEAAQKGQKKSAPPSFPLFPENLIVGTALMSNHEFGIYVRLLCFAWSHDGIPNDIKLIAKLAQGEDVPDCVMTKFSEWPDGRLKNARMEFERAKMMAVANGIATPPVVFTNGDLKDFCTREGIATCLRSDEFPETWRIYIAYRIEKNDPLTSYTRVAILKKCERLGAKDAVKMIRQTIEKSWKSCYESHELKHGDTNAPSGKETLTDKWNKHNRDTGECLTFNQWRERKKI